MRTVRLASIALSVVAVLAGLPLLAGEPALSVRVQKIKGSGKAAKPAVDRELDAHKAKLAVLPYGHARYEALGRAEAQRGAHGADLVFDLPQKQRLHATARPAKATGQIAVHVRITREADRKETEVVAFDLEVKDGETFIQKTEIALEGGGDLLLAITASAERL